MSKPNEIVENVVKALIHARKEQKLSHETVAEKCGLHRTTIGMIESGKNQGTLLTLLKIANALECDLGDLISKAENGEKSP